MNAVSLLGVVFITLKLLGYINWSWWLVTLPFTLPLAVLLVALLVVVETERVRSNRQ